MRKILVTVVLALFGLSTAAAATDATLTFGGFLALSPGDGLNDLRGYDCCSGNLTAIAHENGSRRAQSSVTWVNTTLAYALGLSYPVPTGDGFIPDPDFDVFVIKTSDNGLYKLRQKPATTNTGAGIQLEYEYLGSSVNAPPVASFTVTTYDVIAWFTDTSTGTATFWDWDFGDSTSATAQNPRHVFDFASTSDDFTVMLEAGNTGGTNIASQLVPITKRTSEFTPPGGSKDFDGDGIGDLALFTPGCGAEIPNALQTIGGAEYSTGGDYRTATLADAQSASYNTGAFCRNSAEVESCTFVATSEGSLVKLWIAENDAVLGIRFEYEVLSSGLPDPPQSAFTWSAVDLIASFVDTSTGSPSAWSWSFGDSADAIGATPNHVYYEPGSYEVCLTASNIGGPDSTPACQMVTVAEVPSTLYTAGQSINLDGFGLDDLLVEASSDCGVGRPQRFLPLAGAGLNSLSENYGSVDLADALAVGSYSSSPSCPVVSNIAHTTLVRTGADGYAKLWIPQSDARGVRLVFEVLQSGQIAIFASDFESGVLGDWIVSP